MIEVFPLFLSLDFILAYSNPLKFLSSLYLMYSSTLFFHVTGSRLFALSNFILLKQFVILFSGIFFCHFYSILMMNISQIECLACVSG